MSSHLSDKNRPEQALQRIPALLDAWQAACIANLRPHRDSEFLASRVVREEIRLTQEIELTATSYLDYDMFGYPVWVEGKPGTDQEPVDEFLVMDEGFLELVVKALRCAWRDATGSTRSPSLWDLNNRLGILKRIGELKKKGIEGRNARLFIESKLRTTYQRWEAAIRHHRARRARDVKPPVVKKIPDYSIFECDLPYKWRVRFKNGQRRSKKVGLSKKQDALCRALACETGASNLVPRTVSYKRICQAILPRIIYDRRSGDTDNLHAAARQAVSRFNQKWQSETGDEGLVLCSERKPGGIWKVQVKVIPHLDAEEKEQAERRRRQQR